MVRRSMPCHKRIEDVPGDRGTRPRWAPTSCKWGYNPYKLPYKWVTGVITLLMGVITPFITGRGPPCGVVFVFAAAPK